MRIAYDRNATKREGEEVAFDHISSHQKIEQVKAEQAEAHERDLREREEMKEVSSEEDVRTLQERYHNNFYARLLGYSSDTAYRQMISADEGSHHALVDDAARDLSQRRSFEEMMGRG